MLTHHLHKSNAQSTATALAEAAAATAEAAFTVMAVIFKWHAYYARHAR